MKKTSTKTVVGKPLAAAPKAPSAPKPPKAAPFAKKGAAPKLPFGKVSPPAKKGAPGKPNGFPPAKFAAGGRVSGSPRNPWNEGVGTTTDPEDPEAGRPPAREGTRAIPVPLVDAVIGPTARATINALDRRLGARGARAATPTEVADLPARPLADTRLPPGTDSSEVRPGRRAGTPRRRAAGLSEADQLNERSLRAARAGVNFDPRGTVFKKGGRVRGKK